MAKPFPYRQAWESLQPFVSFRFDPEKQPRTANGKRRYAAERRRVREYFKTLVDLRGSRETVVYRPRKAANLKPAQVYSRMPADQDRWTVAFVPGVAGTRVRVRQGKVQAITDHVARVVHLFRTYERYPGERIRNPQGLAERILQADKRSKRFAGITGQSETGVKVDRKGLAKLIGRIANPNQYEDHAKWFTGVIGYRFEDQSDFTDFKRARAAARLQRAKRKRDLRKGRRGKETP